MRRDRVYIAERGESKSRIQELLSRRRVQRGGCTQRSICERGILQLGRCSAHCNRRLFGSDRRDVRFDPFATRIGIWRDESQRTCDASAARASIMPEITADMAIHFRELGKRVEIEKRIMNWPRSR